MFQPTLKVLSLGAGVQSTTLALMTATGELPMPDCAIFADTQAEPAAVYKHLLWLESVLSFPVYRVTVGSLRADLIHGTARRRRFATIPYFLDRAEEGETAGMGRRQCTREYKIDPLERKIRALLGAAAGIRLPEGSAEVWLGITTDEAHRMRPARRRWQTNRFPLIDARLSRADCLGWLRRGGYPIPIKSACTFCPYRSDESWLKMKQSDHESWTEAVEVDAALRGGQHNPALRAVPYLHRSLQPLDQVDLRSWAERGQPDLFGAECEGMCGT